MRDERDDATGATRLAGGRLKAREISATPALLDALARIRAFYGIDDPPHLPLETLAEQCAHLGLTPTDDLLAVLASDPETLELGISLEAACVGFGDATEALSNWSGERIDDHGFELRRGAWICVGIDVACTRAIYVHERGTDSTVRLVTDEGVVRTSFTDLARARLREIVEEARRSADPKLIARAAMAEGDVTPLSPRIVAREKRGAGVLVRHPRFGRGEIVEDLEGGIVRVRFADGERRMLRSRLGSDDLPP